MERKMFFGASPANFANAKHLRDNMTLAEKLLWNELRKNKMGVRFKPQHPMIHYIADFYSYALKLIIEVDGPIHNSRTEYDNERTQSLEQAGNIVIRFTNDQIINNMPEVLACIRSKMDEISAQLRENKQDK